MTAPTFLAAVIPAAVSDATFVNPRPFKFSCSPLRILEKLHGISLPINFLSRRTRAEDAKALDSRRHALIVVSDRNDTDVLVLPNTNPVRLILKLRIRRRISGHRGARELHPARMQDVTTPIDQQRIAVQ